MFYEISKIIIDGIIFAVKPVTRRWAGTRTVSPQST